MKEVDYFNEIVDNSIDYTKFKNGADLLNSLGDEGYKWATAFSQYAKQKLDVEIEIAFAAMWFANAIEHSTHIRNIAKEKLDKEKTEEL
jgi:hypothetical protein